MPVITIVEDYVFAAMRRAFAQGQTSLVADDDADDAD
jgi:hypothetical protein